MDTKWKANNPFARVKRYYEQVNNSLRRISFDFRILVATAIWWLIALGIGNLSFRGYRSDIALSYVVTVLLIAFGVFVLRFSHLLVSPNILMEQWRNSLLLRYLRTWQGGFTEYRIALPIVSFALLSAAAGIVGYRLYGYYRYVEEKWLILYLCIYVLFIFPSLLSFAGKFRRLLLETKEISRGNLQAKVEIEGNGPISELAAQINNMRIGYGKALEVQMKSERLKSELITNVSHDLKTPLTSIINYVDLLKKEQPGSDKIGDYVEVLDRKSLRLKALIEDLFEASKMASGTIELDIQRIDVVALLDQAVAEFKDKFEHSSLFLRMKISKPHIYAYLDGNKTWRLFENLLSNALKYSLSGTRVYVYLDEADDRVSFRIQNTALYEIDFAPEELFERFKRADESRHTEGSGLGLAIAKSIVELQGGDIRIEVSGDQFNVLIDFPIS
ncbi:HAMP domain-containing sensor histidine kinase [Cohnella mopanensis]|uniref:HAMP domain-containing sensor histidine kinase n=1 Tax=Cohnella mopanensis TaxID=2911966 RepID=UPI001EF851E5|nr:HAMP domain-containing sensor histidine kinase [Cohnella mopanensis]